jgi:glucokinase
VSLVLGLDVGGTKLAAGLVDDRGAVSRFASVPADAADGPAAVIERLLALAASILDARPAGDPVEAVGIACGGPLDVEAGTASPLHEPGWRDVPIRAIVAEALGVPAHLENDATAAALAEARFGAGAGMRDLVYLTLSTGVGGGLVLGGRPHRGRTGNGAEIGHIVVVADGGRPCSCGGAGCLEAYASGTSVARRAAEVIRAGAVSALDADSLTARDVVEAAAAGDAVAREVWSRTIVLLGAAIASLVDVLDPDIVVLGGGLTGAGDRLFGPLEAAVAAHVMPVLGRRPLIVPAALGPAVGVVGAATVARDAHGSVG